VTDESWQVKKSALGRFPRAGRRNILRASEQYERLSGEKGKRKGRVGMKRGRLNPKRGEKKRGVDKGAHPMTKKKGARTLGPKRK